MDFDKFASRLKHQVIKYISKKRIFPFLQQKYYFSISINIKFFIKNSFFTLGLKIVQDIDNSTHTNWHLYLYLRNNRYEKFK